MTTTLTALGPTTIEMYASPSLSGIMQTRPAPETDKGAATDKRDRYTLRPDNTATCYSTSGRVYLLHAAVYDGAHKVYKCECDRWRYSAKCRHGDRYQVLLDADDAAQVALLTEFPGVKHMDTQPANDPCAACGGIVVRARLWGRWPVSKAVAAEGYLLCYRPGVTTVCGCGILPKSNGGTA